MASQPAQLCAERSFCEGEGLSQAQAGELASFRITARDQFGNLQTAGGDDISVNVASAAGDEQASVMATVSDLGRGMYKVCKDRVPASRRTRRSRPYQEGVCGLWLL